MAAKQNKQNSMEQMTVKLDALWLKWDREHILCEIIQYNVRFFSMSNYQI